MPSEPAKGPRRTLALLALCAAGGALALWLARPMPASPEGVITSESPLRAAAPSASPPPPPAAAAASDDRGRAQATAPAASEGPESNAAPHVRNISPSMRVPFATPPANAAPGVRASEAACTALFARIQRGEALDSREQLRWQRSCRSH